MNSFFGNYKHTRTTKFLIQLNIFVFAFGLPSYWVEKLNISDKVYKIYQRINTVGNVCIFVLLFSEFGAFFTQRNLTEEQVVDLMLYTIAQGIIIFFTSRMIYLQPKIKSIMYKLGIELKEVYNDSEVETAMIKKSKFFSGALVTNCIMALTLKTLEAGVKTMSTGEPFNTVITIVPDINDNSTVGNTFRVIYNIFWWIYVTRVFSVYTLVICLTTAMSHQFSNINSYFYSLNNIFEENNGTTHKKMEEKYEKSLKIGIALHAESLKCTKQIQTICKEVFSGQIIFNVTLLILIMYQMVNSERTLTNAISIIVTAATILLSTGFFMWNAGDITIEAQKTLTAMYCSGWENCYGECSKRIRKFMVISMMQAQRPVYLTGLGVIALSYQSYVSIVKSSYSVFSVLY